MAFEPKARMMEVLKAFIAQSDAKTMTFDANAVAILTVGQVIAETIHLHLTEIEAIIKQ